jgi:hypothetical protein
MTFLKERRRRGEMLRRRITTTKPSPVVLALVAAVVSVGGYVLFLAILAPEQVAEATAAASDLVCSGCVGTSDIADSAVTSSKIGSGQVSTSDIATDAITSTKIRTGEVRNSDLGTSAVTSSKISDTAGVQSVDIVNGQVKTEDIASGAIQLNYRLLIGGGVNVDPGENKSTTIDCPAGEIMTGGGFSSEPQIRVFISAPLDDNTWMVQGINEGELSANLAASVSCIDATAP